MILVDCIMLSVLIVSYFSFFKYSHLYSLSYGFVHQNLHLINANFYELCHILSFRWALPLPLIPLGALPQAPIIGACFSRATCVQSTFFDLATPLVFDYKLQQFVQCALHRD